MPIDINVKFFASCRDLAGVSSIVVSCPDVTTTTDLVLILLDMYPNLTNGINEVSLAVNKQYVDGPVALSNSDEVAFLPPMSGG